MWRGYGQENNQVGDKSAKQRIVEDDPNPKVPGGPQISRIELLKDPELKVVIVVAETPNCRPTSKMNCGMAAAQAAHAMNKLMASYLGWLMYIDARSARVHDYVRRLRDEPITTVILKARDTKEPHHIFNLAESCHLLCVEYSDTNPTFFGTPYEVVTAVAIGPYLKYRFDGITDYLPAWNCSCGMVS